MGRPQKNPDLTTYRGRLAAAIRARREELGMSVVEVAERLEALGSPVTAHAVYKYETGERPVMVDHLPLLAKALRTTPHELLPKK